MAILLGGISLRWRVSGGHRFADSALSPYIGEVELYCGSSAEVNAKKNNQIIISITQVTH